MLLALKNYEKIIRLIKFSKKDMPISFRIDKW